jgi:hypothetical protein
MSSSNSNLNHQGFINDDRKNNYSGNNEGDVLLESASESDDEEETFGPESPFIEISGLDKSSNGRNCTQHICCGKYVNVNDVLRLKHCIVEVDNEPENAIKLVKLSGGNESCTVAFLPRIYYNLPKVQRNINKTVQVFKLYKEGSSYEKEKNKINGGMATCVFLNDIPIEE